MNPPEQERSTYSNFGFIASGLAIAIYGGIIEDGLLAYAGIMHFALGLASGLFHWTLDYFWQKADEIAMFGFFNAAMARGIGALAPGLEVELIVISLVLTGVMGYFHRRFDNDTVGLLGLINLIVLFARGGWIHLGIVFVAYLVAYYFNQKGQIEGSVRHRDKPHARWHWIAAGANTGLII